MTEAEQERAAICGWLVDCAAKASGADEMECLIAMLLTRISSQIRRGDHLKDTPA